MIVQQVFFWIMIVFFALLSAIKTIQKYLNADIELVSKLKFKFPFVIFNKQKYTESTASIFTLNDEPEKSRYRVVASESNKIPPSTTIFTVESEPELLKTVQSAEENNKKLKQIRIKERKHYIKLLLNYSISLNSTILVVGGIAEAYLYGVRLFGNILSILVGHIYAFVIIFPFMYSLDSSLKTPYDYLQKRYNNVKYVKLVCLVVAMFYYVGFISLFLFGCAVALNVLMPSSLSIQTACILLGVYSLAGSLIGGFIQSTKLNVFQFLLVFGGIFVSIVMTIVKHGTSLPQMLNFAAEHNRTILFDLHVDLTTRYTLLNQLSSLTLPWCAKIGIFLPNYMRYRTISNRTKARIFFISNIPIMIVANLLSFMGGGIFCFVYFYGCDPLKAGHIINKNQVGVYWIQTALNQNIPIVCGVVFSCIIFYSLVQHSNGMAVVSKTLYDEIINVYLLDKLNIKEKLRKAVSYTLIVFIGILSILLADAFQYAKNTILSLFFAFNNTTNSPILGLFLVSMLNPYANAPGVTCAFILNLAINYWMALGAIVFSKTPSQEFSSTTDLCSNSSNYTTATNPVLIQDSYYPKDERLYFLYSIASIWYCLFSVLFTIIFGCLFSLIYSIIRTNSFDADRSFSDRKKYLFFYRLIKNTK